MDIDWPYIAGAAAAAVAGAAEVFRRKRKKRARIHTGEYRGQERRRTTTVVALEQVVKALGDLSHQHQSMLRELEFHSDQNKAILETSSKLHDAVVETMHQLQLDRERDENLTAVTRETVSEVRRLRESTVDGHSKVLSGMGILGNELKHIAKEVERHASRKG